MSQNLDVLIVGAGPVGLTMATMLHHQNVSNYRIIEKTAVASDKSKALVIWSRSLELLHKAGVVPALAERGLWAHGANIYGEGKKLVHISLDRLPSPYKAALFIPQCDTEAVLDAHVKDVGHAVERQVELVQFHDDGEGVDCTLRHGDGTEEQVRTRFLAGCDGAHSTVRHILQMPFEGHTLLSKWALADVYIDGEISEDELSVFWDADGIMAVFPMGHERFRIIVDMPPPTNVPPAKEGDSAMLNADDNSLTLEEMQKLTDVRVRRGWTLRDPKWLTKFTINERKVKDYSRGNVFLAGDAAHIHSPAGGQGMNTGMQDAANFAWKAALVLKGLAPGSLLDSYNVERTAIGHEIVSNADRLTTVATVRGSLKQHVRNSIVRFLGHFHFVEHKLANQLAELSISYPQSPVVSEHSDRLAWILSRGVAPGYRAPDVSLADAEGKPVTLFNDVLSTPEHVMILFNGLHFDADAICKLEAMARNVAEKYEEQIETVMVTLEPLDEWSGRMYIDEDGDAHRAYGAGHATVYVIRPDGYVGFRGQPAHPESLQQWLEQVFIPRQTPVLA